MPIDDAAFAALLADVEAESSALLLTLETLPAEKWSTPTPAEGWDIHDQVVHLATFDELAALGFSDPVAFSAAAAAILATGDDWVDQINITKAAVAPAQLLDWFRASRRELIESLASAGPASRTPWFGPPMSAASSATARLMETWAHGQDICDALAVTREPTDRIRHLCHLGVITRGFSFQNRGLDAPTDDVRVELLSPGGDRWTWGPDAADQRITGTAIDFALLVTQRRHRADTALLATAGAASDWLDVAQAFAGNVGAGRSPGQFGKAS